MGRKKETQQNFDEAFSRLRKLENDGVEVSTILKQLLKMQEVSQETFDRHDEKEMEKYDKYDEHLQDVNKTLTKMLGKIENLASAQEDYRTSLSQVSSEIIAKENKMQKTIEDTEERVYKTIENKDDKISKQLDSINTSINDNKKDSDDKFKQLFKYFYMAMGIIVFIPTVWAVGTWLYDLQSQKLKEEHKQNELLEKRLERYEKNQAINYGRQQVIMSKEK